MAKLTQKIVNEWLEAAWRDGFTKGVDGDDTLPDFSSFDPRGKEGGGGKSDSSPEELSKLPFDECRCSARVFRSGYGIQCSRKSHAEGKGMCLTHLKKHETIKHKWKL